MKITLTLAFLVTAVVFSCKGNITEGPRYDGRADDMPDRCRGKDFCIYRGGKHYPQREINSILKKFPPIQHRYGSDEKYDSRVGDHPSFPECDTNETGYKPVYYIKENEKTTRVVVQSQKYNVEQKYEIKWCTKPGPANETLHFRRRDLKNVNMTCENVQTSLVFLVLSLNRTDIEMIAVPMPVFCKARYTLK